MPASEETLRALMLASLNGDAVAHGALLRALLPVLRGFFARRLPGRHDLVEDLVQEVLIAVHEKRATYDTTRPFGGWLFAIARYRMIDHFRRRGSREIPLDAVEDLQSAADEHGASDARRDLETLLATLTPKQADAIRATQLEGL